VPFTGKLDEGPERGTYKSGKREGPWVGYWSDGRLKYKGAFKNGEREGPWLWYNEDGTKYEDLSGTYRNGEKISD
jgi:antitoxin component YwqK of YwqJK toxin-antitoxin module